MNQKIGVAVVGTGNRGRGVVGRLLKDSDHNVRVAAVYDPDAAETAVMAHLKNAIERLGKMEPIAE